ncbi:MAG: twin-arginine translocation signal domain-containing protein [Hymenobacter sp.]|nr:MAG: twin-arginine translocation signal domain-containing protein [Hymenobacter sp.]
MRLQCIFVVQISYVSRRQFVKTTAAPCGTAVANLL